MGSRYTIGRPYKPGPNSVVYIGFDHQNSDAKVAIKEYFPSSIVKRRSDGYVLVREGHESEFERNLHIFEKEADILEDTRHENIVSFVSSESQNGTAYIVTDFCGYESLTDLCARTGGKLEEVTAVNIMIPVLDALEVVHRRGIIHCDINPDNIHIRPSGRPILLDFGSARYIDGTRNTLRPVTFNPGYSAPEQHSGRLNEYGQCTDIYSCAATLYRITTGAVLTSAPQRTTRDKVSVVLVSRNTSELLDRSLLKDASERLQNISDFRAKLSRASELTSQTYYQPSPGTTRLKEMGQSILDKIPYLLTVIFFLGALVFIYSESPEKISPQRFTYPDLTIEPADYYVLRDSSLSKYRQHHDIEQYYSLVEDIVDQSLRSTDQGGNIADYLSYAYFASSVFQGPSSLQPAARGSLEESRQRLSRWPLPRDFSAKTDFSVLFRDLSSAIHSGLDRKGKPDREIVVAIITDGVHDPDGNRGECLNTDSAQANFFDFFDEATRANFESLALTQRVHVMLILLGGAPRVFERYRASMDCSKEEATSPIQIAGQYRPS